MKRLYCFMVFTILFSCNRASQNATMEKEIAAASEPLANSQDIAISSMPPETRKSLENTTIPELKLIKEGHLSLEIEDFKNTTRQLSSFLAPFEAYISHENQTNDVYSIRNQYTLRVPAKLFDTLIIALQSIAIHIEHKSISSNDVSEEYIDIEARLKTKKIYEEKYFQLMNKAKNLSELIEIQNQLRAIREEIESMEGRMKYLNSQTSMSTIHLTLFEKVDYLYREKENGFVYRFKKSLLSGWDTSLNILFGLFSIWPITIIFVILVFLLKRHYQKKTKQ